MLSKQSLIKYGYAGCLLLGVTLSGCTKYAPAENIADAAYIRVFNSITAKPDPIDGGAVNPFLTFLIDPVTDQHGTITGAPVMCDYLNTRQLFSASYPMDAGTAPDLPTTVNTGVYASTTYYGPLNFEPDPGRRSS